MFKQKKDENTIIYLFFEIKSSRFFIFDIICQVFGEFCYKTPTSPLLLSILKDCFEIILHWKFGLKMSRFFLGLGKIAA